MRSVRGTGSPPDLPGAHLCVPGRPGLQTRSLSGPLAYNPQIAVGANIPHVPEHFLPYGAEPVF